MVSSGAGLSGWTHFGADQSLRWIVGSCAGVDWRTDGVPGRFVAAAIVQTIHTVIDNGRNNHVFSPLVVESAESMK